MKQIQKKAMNSFETIAVAIIVLIVIIVSIAIFTKLTKGPSTTIGNIGDNTAKNTDECIKNPGTCNPLATTSPDESARTQNNIESYTHA